MSQVWRAVSGTESLFRFQRVMAVPDYSLMWFLTAVLNVLPHRWCHSLPGMESNTFCFRTGLSRRKSEETCAGKLIITGCLGDAEGSPLARRPDCPFPTILLPLSPAHKEVHHDCINWGRRK